MIIDPRELDRQIRIERSVPGAGVDDAGSGTWVLFEDKVWAGIRDMLPSRAERIADGINVAARPARVRMFWRPGITADMRFVEGDRIMQIVAGPAELGRRDGLEFIVEDYSTAGNAA